MTALDRLIGLDGLGRWAMVLVLGTGLVIFGDFIGSLGFYVGVLASERWWLLFAHYICRLPGFLALWMPFSVLVAAMLAAAPMLRQGTLMALSGAGIGPARAFAPFLAVAVLAGGTAFALGDQLVPRLEPVAERYRARMKRGDDWQRERVVGWRSGPTMWTVGSALPEAGAFAQIAAFQQAGGRRLVVTADRLTWIDGQGWRLEGVELADGDRLQQVGTGSPAQLGLQLDEDLGSLANRLRPDSSRTSGELAASGSPRFTEVLCMRLAGALLPLLCLLYGLPRFARWGDRQRLVFAGIQAMAWAAVPVLGAGILGRLLVSAGAHPVPLAAGVLGAIAVGGWWRWRGMRL